MNEDQHKNENSSNLLNLDNLKKDKIIEELPNKLGEYLKSFEYDDMIILKNLIYDDIELNNRTADFNFIIDLNRDEMTVITLLKELYYNLNQRHKTVYQLLNIVREHISSFFSTFTTQNMGEPSVTQIEFDKEEAQKRFMFSEWVNYKSDKSMTSSSIVSMAKPTGDKSKDENNKEIVIHSLFALHDNTVPNDLYKHLMSIQQPNFYNIISQLARVLDEFRTFVGGIYLYILPIEKLEHRLIHGLKLYEFIFLYKQLDINIPESSNHMIIFDQLQQSYKEDFQVTSIPFNEYEVKKAILEMESRYQI